MHIPTRARGFVSLGLILIVVIAIAAIVGAGWWANKHVPSELNQAPVEMASTTQANDTGRSAYTDAVFGFKFLVPAGVSIAQEQTNFYQYGNQHEFLRVSLAGRQIGRIIVNETVEGLMGPEQTKVSTSTITIAGASAEQEQTEELASDGSVASTVRDVSFEHGGDQYVLSFSYDTPAQRAAATQILQTFSF